METGYPHLSINNKKREGFIQKLALVIACTHVHLVGESALLEMDSVWQVQLY